MNQQVPPENPNRRRPSITLAKADFQDTISKDTIDNLNSTAENASTKGSDEGLLPLVTIRNSTGERTSDSFTSTIEDLASPSDAPLTPSPALFSPNPSNSTSTSNKKFSFTIEENPAYSRELERPKSDIGQARPLLSKTLGNAITDIDPDGSLRQKTIRSKTLFPEGVEQKSELPGFKILTQEQIKQEHDYRSSSEKEFNISDSTIAKLRNIAQSNEIVIITRPVNSTALTLMKQDAVGKNMFVHGKSAAEDSLAEGLITVNAGSSKAGKDDNENKIKAYNAENRASLKRSQELLELVQARLQEVAPRRRSRLQKDLENLDKKSEFTEQEVKYKAAIEKELKEGPQPDQLLQEAKIPAEYFDQMVFAAPVLDKKGNQIYVFEDEFEVVKKEDKQQIHAIEEGGKTYFIDKNHNHNATPQEVPDGYKKIPLQVIGKPEITIGRDGSLNIGKVRPITADIDVLAYGAKVNLQEFDKMPSYHEVVAGEKQKLLNSSTSYSAEKFKDIEVQMEHLKGMGSAPEFVTAITGAMRGEFKDSVEISHNSEQFNIGFTQALDEKWVLIDNKGKVSTISGEKELLETFSRFKAEGLSMPPNPNWGWELREGRYEKNKNLVEISASCQQLCLKMYTLKEDHAKATESEKEKIGENIKFIADILKLQTETGLMAITEPRDRKKLDKHIQNLREQIRGCRKKGIIIKSDVDQINKYKESRLKIYDLTYDSRNIAEAAKEYSEIPKSLTSTLDGTLRTGNKQTLPPISGGLQKDLKVTNPLALSTNQNTGKLEQHINADLKREILYVAERIRANLTQPGTNSSRSTPSPLNRNTSRDKNGGRGI